MSLKFTSIAANRINQGLDVMDSICCYAAGNFVVVYSGIGQDNVTTLKGHLKTVTAVQLMKSSNGSYYIVSGSADTMVIVWEYVENRWIIKSKLKGHQAGIVALGVMQGNANEMLFASSDSASNICIWNIVDNQIELIQTIVLKPHIANALALGYIHESLPPFLISGGTDFKVHIYRFENNQFEKVLSLDGHTDWIRSIKVCHVTETDADHGLLMGDVLIATASQDKYIRIWKVTRSVEEEKSEFMEMVDQLMQGNGKLSTKAHVLEWGSTNVTFLLDAVLMGHDDWVFSLNWAPTIIQNGSLHQPMQLVSASADKSIMIWLPDKYSETWITSVRLGEVGGTTLGFYGAVLTKEKKLYSNGYNGSIHIWKQSDTDASVWSPEVGISGHAKSVQDCQWNPTGSFLLTTSLDQTSRIFAPWNRDETATWHEISRSQIHGYDLQCCSFTSKYQYISGADEKVVRVFEAPKTFAQSLEKITGEQESKSIIESRPLGANIPALGLSNKAVYEGDAPQASLDVRLNAYTATGIIETQATILMQPPFEEHLLQHTLWPETEKLYGHGFEIMTITSNRHGTLIATTSKANKSEHATIRIWSTENWKEVCTPLEFHTLTVTTIQFSHCGKYCISAGRDRGWALFDVSKATSGEWKLVQGTPKAHQRIIWSSTFSHDDEYIAFGSRDKTISVWKRAQIGYSSVTLIPFEQGVTSVSFYHSKVHDQYRIINDRYILGIGFENGDISIAYLNESGTVDRITKIDSSITHQSTVTKISWRPNHILQFASSSEDHSVRMFQI